MKTIQRNFFISLIPLLTPMTAFGEPPKQAELVSPIPGTKGSTASWRASQVMGLNVKNVADETIGEVQDLVLDMKAGEILAVIISSGGFLGISNTLSAVPVSFLRYDDTAKAFKTKLTKEQLNKAPQFKSDAWPDYSTETSTEMLRSYRDLISGVLVAPDNSAQNEKEINKDAVTPTDQGSSAQDVQITKNIRSAIMETDLSFNAKNIKIITRNENVILKGVVESHVEHEKILKIVGNYTNKSNLTDELKVNAQ